MSRGRHTRAVTGQGQTRYEPRAWLGQGTLGMVYRVWDAALDEEVALKVLGGVGPRDLARFERTLRQWIRAVRHPALARYRELVVMDGQQYLAMDLVAGDDFVQYVTGGRASPRTDPGGDGPRPATAADVPRLEAALRLLVDGLCGLHSAGVVHGDIKPSNVRVPTPDRIAILDWGLTEALGGRADSVFGAPELGPPVRRPTGTRSAACCSSP